VAPRVIGLCEARKITGIKFISHSDRRSICRGHRPFCAIPDAAAVTV
jgi:hypothetical protein